MVRTVPMGEPAVAVDVTPLVGPRTGIGASVAHAIAALADLPDGPRLVPYALSLRARSHRTALPPTTRFVPLPARLLLRRWTTSEHPRIDRWLRPAAVLHATNYLAPPSRLPTLVTVNDLTFVRYPDLVSDEVRATAVVVRRAVARGASIHTASEFVAAEVEEHFGPGLQDAGRIVVVPWGVPPVAAAGPVLPPAARAGPYVLAIGTLEPRKNLPKLVEAFGAVAAAHPDLRLVLAGPDGPDSPAVRQAILGLPAAPRSRVVVTGAVSDADRCSLLHHATLLAYPSLYEGFGFPVLEAMTAGVPVVAARRGSIPEVADGAALLVDPDDEHDLARAIDSLVRDEGLRARLVAAGEVRAATYSWRATAEGLTTTYRQLAR